MDPISKGEMFVGFLFYLSMVTSNHALTLISFPMQAMVKSSKILPVMLMGILWGTYNYSWKKYCAAALITVGLVIFSYGNSMSKMSKEEINPFGIALLLFSLFFDGLL